ncbi:MAG: energy transducer TonB [Deltaproteobacteria bacterium]|nr:energy transducer TonB [Deltaproteobacteria bacterium]
MIRPRFLITIALAAGITFGLFWLMQFLISMKSGLYDESKRGRVVDFVRLKRESELEVKKRKLPEKQEREEEPPPPDIDFSATPRPGQQTLAIAAPSADFDLALAGGLHLGGAPSDSDIIPLVRVLPQYPPRAASRGIEGWVVVEFTISAAGTVKDPVIIDAHPSSIFNRAMLRAIRKWKYRPKIVDGVAVERTGVRVRQNFSMEDS